MLRTSIVSFVLLLGGCDRGSSETKVPDAGAGAPTAGAPAASDDGASNDGASNDGASDDAASDDTSVAAAPTPEPPKRERIRIHNSCSKPVKLRIERMNDSDSNTTLSSNTGMEERATDGDEVRLLDDNNNVVHVVKIEPAMQEVDIASSCTQVVGK